MAALARRILSRVTTTKPRMGMRSTPIHLHQVPRLRFSGIAMRNRIRLVSRRQFRSDMSFTLTPTANIWASSVKK